jgi:putative transposase
MSSDIRRGRHCVFAMHVHLVFVAKYRKKVFDSEILNEMKDIFNGICLKNNAELKEFNGEDDHVHLLVNYPPKISISVLVNALKGVSSRILRRDFQTLGAKSWKGNLWTPSYFAGSCGGTSLEVLKEYIEKQNRPL